MKILKKIGRTLLYLLLTLVFLLGTYSSQEMFFGMIPVNDNYNPEAGEIECFVVSTGVHTDVLVPVSTDVIDWTKQFPESDYEPILVGPEYVGFGWGDRGFFMETPTWDDLKVSTALTAMFLPSETVMHVFYSEDKPMEGKMVRSFKLTRHQYQQLVAFIKESFEVPDDKLPEPYVVEKDFYWQNDRFYPGSGSYFCTYTCNTWTNHALQAAGVRTALWTPFPERILDKL